MPSSRIWAQNYVLIFLDFRTSRSSRLNILALPTGTLTASAMSWLLVSKQRHYAFWAYWAVNNLASWCLHEARSKCKSLSMLLECSCSRLAARKHAFRRESTQIIMSAAFQAACQPISSSSSAVCNQHASSNSEGYSSYSKVSLQLQNILNQRLRAGVEAAHQGLELAHTVLDQWLHLFSHLSSTDLEASADIWTVQTPSPAAQIQAHARVWSTLKIKVIQVCRGSACLTRKRRWRVMQTWARQLPAVCPLSPLEGCILDLLVTAWPHGDSRCCEISKL